MSIIIVLIGGLIIGGILGTLVAALCVAASKKDEVSYEDI